MKIPDPILLVDTETTGLEPPAAKLIEIGAILYSTSMQCSLISIATLLQHSDGTVNDAERVNKIPTAAIQLRPFSGEYLRMTTAALDTIDRMRMQAEVFIAHNAEFDQRFLDGPAWKQKPWLCTKSDFSFTRARAGLSLRDLALEYGVGIGVAHRALVDVQLMAEIFSRMTPSELETEFLLAMRPRNEYRAIGGMDLNPKFKEAGFRWNGEKKMWHKKMAEADTALLPFEVRRVNP